MNDYIYKITDLRYSLRVRNWCSLPYPGHRKGCPNYRNATHCPDQIPFITNVLDISKPMFIVHSEFDLAAHAARMKEKHPNWSERQCRNLLYWQGTSRKQLRDRVIKALCDWENEETTAINFITYCPEGMGVNVYSTARHAGLILEPIKTLKTCRHVALLGCRKA